MTDSADQLIKQLQLEAHPEGGWYRETWRAQANASGRACGTAIIFLLKTAERSHWHRVDADEMWLWQAGDPLELQIAQTDSGPVESTLLSANLSAGHQLQGLVPKTAWQAAQPVTPSKGAHGYTLVSCIVVPGFEFAGFELADPDWAPAKHSAQ